MAFKKEMAEEEARYQATCEARDATWKKKAVELWGRAHRHVKEVYEDGYFARKVKGTLQESATLPSATADGKGKDGERQRPLPSATDGKRLR